MAWLWRGTLPWLRVDPIGSTKLVINGGSACHVVPAVLVYPRDDTTGGQYSGI